MCWHAPGYYTPRITSSCIGNACTKRRTQWRPWRHWVSDGPHVTRPTPKGRCRGRWWQLVAMCSVPSTVASDPPPSTRFFGVVKWRHPARVVCGCGRMNTDPELMRPYYAPKRIRTRQWTRHCSNKHHIVDERWWEYRRVLAPPDSKQTWIMDYSIEVCWASAGLFPSITWMSKGIIDRSYAIWGSKMSSDFLREQGPSPWHFDPCVSKLRLDLYRSGSNVNVRL